MGARPACARALGFGTLISAEAGSPLYSNIGSILSYALIHKVIMIYLHPLIQLVFFCIDEEILEICFLITIVIIVKDIVTILLIYNIEVQKHFSYLLKVVCQLSQNYLFNYTI